MNIKYRYFLKIKNNSHECLSTTEINEKDAMYIVGSEIILDIKASMRSRSLLSPFDLNQDERWMTETMSMLFEAYIFEKDKRFGLINKYTCFDKIVEDLSNQQLFSNEKDFFHMFSASKIGEPFVCCGGRVRLTAIDMGIYREKTTAYLAEILI